jgi:RNA polymerase sigma-70 factor, ECF subfamily
MSVAPDPLEDSFVRLRQRLRSYLRRRLPDDVPIDDVLQDIFVKAIVSRQSGRAIVNLNGWLYAAARTAVADHFRRRDIATESLEEAPAASNEADALQLHIALSSCLRALIDGLPVHYQRTLIATELEGRTQRSLADELGVSVSAVKSRAARGKSLLKARVLACCHVEMKDGLVSDYHRRSSVGCAGQCS